MNKSSRTAIAHHWLTGMRGGERVLEEILSLFPQATLHTLVRIPKKLSPALAKHPTRQSWLGLLPGSAHFYRHTLPLHPAAIRSLHVAPDTQWLISSDASLIKGIQTPEGCRHLCYCHSPPRYLWDLQETYLQSHTHSGLITRTAFNFFSQRLRNYDFQASQKVDLFVANSRFTASRIRTFYGRDSVVVYPPVDTDFFHPGNEPRSGSSFLIVSSLVPYKRVDLAICACNELNVPLTIIGDGPERSFLERIAGPGIRFLGRQTDETIRHHYRNSRALLFPTLEDFGMVPVEAQACGCPVLAFGEGGALESIQSGLTGRFFPEQTSESLVHCLKDFLEEAAFLPAEACRESALRFSKNIFRDHFMAQAGILQKLS